MIGVDPKRFNVLPRACLATSKRYIQIAKIVLRCFQALKFVQDEARKVVGATHLNDETIASSRNTSMVLLIRSAQHNLTNQDKPKSISLLMHFTGMERRR